MLPVNRIGNGTLFSLPSQGVDVTTKMPEKKQPPLNPKIMNVPIVSTEAKARLAEAVKNYTPPPPEKYRALNEVKESIIALRERQASYATIRAMLHESAGIEVSHQTVARYCREVLDAARAKKPRRPKRPPTAQPPINQTEPVARPSAIHLPSRGPRIAASEWPMAALPAKKAHDKCRNGLGDVEFIRPSSQCRQFQRLRPTHVRFA